MTYYCSECGKQVGRILDKDEKTLTFRCPWTRHQAVAMTPFGVA